jgi:hypothetical protein
MNINLMTWFAERKLDYLPKHFIPVNAYIDEERHLWILEKCTGRFYIGHKNNTESSEFLFLLEEEIVYFEDPQEAVLYELTWS